ncbi:MAG: hypothetical protein FJY82_10170 [Candidatus Aminicenantes bacterium]|nr:hypothetical protein [Candidatus Aminicenantes bacterium]
MLDEERDLRDFEIVDDQTADIYRKMTPAGRLQIAFGLWRSAQSMLMNILRAQHPDWGIEQIQGEAARRMSHGAV